MIWSSFFHPISRHFSSPRKTGLLVLVVATTLGLMFSMPVQSQPSGMVAGLVADMPLQSPEHIKTFYEKRGLKPVWIRGLSDFQPRVEAVLKILDQSWMNGLNPSDYKTADIKKLLEAGDSAARQKADIMITDSVLHYIQDMTGMRGGHYPLEKQTKYWRTPMEEEKILSQFGELSDPISFVRSVEPKGRLYQSLRRALVDLAAMPDDSGFKSIQLSYGIKPGKTHARIPDLRARLGLSPLTENKTVYDEALAVEVMKLQAAYGLETDGVIGGRTLEIINMKRSDKIAQIIANMERLRWIDDGRPNRYILVNIPSANLWAVEDGTVKLEMPVIIGKTARPTHSFKTDITGVRFNPNWTVPPTIKREDFLPALQQDPEILTKRGIRITYQGQVVDPKEVDWTKVSPSAMANLRMIQNPGDDNPLGKVRVIMENPFNIYLHDTNHREMFDDDERALSSGCIRVSKPEELAEFILARNDGWTRENMQKMISSGRMRDVPTDESLPVYIMYQTVWLDSDGRLVYGRDVYGQDQKLFGMLQKSGSIHIPTPSEITEISL